VFLGDADVVVREDRDPKFWFLEQELVCQGEQDQFRVERAFRTDFASVPRMFVWFLPRYGRYTRAAILHDSLWDQAKLGAIAWRDADALFRRVMRELGVPLLRRWIMWAAVRWGALAHLGKGSGTGWWRDAPLVLMCTLLALPIVLPPAVLIVAALAVFFVYELIAWLALALGRTIKKLFGRTSPKQLNRPKYSLKTT